jgi:hypothetical protein
MRSTVLSKGRPRHDGGAQIKRFDVLLIVKTVLDEALFYA